MQYPFFFEPAYQDRIWGGHALEHHFGRALGGRRIAESWEISCHDHGMSVVSEGLQKGMDLKSVIEQYPVEVLGSDLIQGGETKFPLLVKFLDAADILSVQVHPDDAYAARHENGELGKTEMWYVAAARPGAQLICGVKAGVTRGQFYDALQAGTLEHCLNPLPVTAGDVVFIPAGLLHAIGDGILICEIQQNSDATYRVYDFNRWDASGAQRELHVEKAMDVIDFEGRLPAQTLPGLTVPVAGGEKIYYAACRYFAMEKLKVQGNMAEGTDGKRFCTLTCVEGGGTLLYPGGSAYLPAGRSCLIPAALPAFTLSGDMTVLKAYVPDRQENIIKPLTEAGCSPEDLSVIAGLYDAAP